MGSSSLSRNLLFDPVRQIWVKATPEEIVRQRWMEHMMSSLGFPKELFVIEKNLAELPHLQGKRVSDRRIDLLVYVPLLERLDPLLLIECKQGSLSSLHTEQLIGYNVHVGAPYVALVNHDEVRFGFRRAGAGEYQFHHFLPSFAELKKWIVA